MEKKKIIKRYQNRKLYDTEESRYVTLDDIAKMIQDGYDIKVVANKTDEDLTSVTLAQIIFEEEKKKKSILPISALKKLIQHGGASLQDFIEKLVSTTDTTLSAIREEAEKYIQRLVRHGEISKDDASKSMKDVISSYQKNFLEFQKKMDQRIKEALDKVTGIPTLKTEVKTLEDKLSKLEEELEEVKKHEKKKIKD